MIWTNTADDRHRTTFVVPFGQEITVEIYPSPVQDQWKFRLMGQLGERIYFSKINFDDFNNEFQNLKQAKEESVKIFAALCKGEFARFWKKF